MDSRFGELRTVLVSAIAPNPRQPRKYFSEEDIKEFAQSIHEEGLLQLMKLEDVGEGNYYIRDGERRWRAIQLLGWNAVQAMVYPPESDVERKRLLQAMVANVHRKDINPIERAMAYQALLADGHSKNDIARKLRTSATTIKNMIDLLNLEPEVQELIAFGKFPSDHRAYNALMVLPAGDVRVKMVKRIAREGLSIRTIEKACAELRSRLAEARKEEQRRRVLGAEKPQKEVSVSTTQQRPPSHKRINRAASTVLAFGETMEAPPTKTSWRNVYDAAAATCATCDVNPRLPDAASPAWEIVLLSAEETCSACSLKPKDQKFIQSFCGACPAVVILKKLAGIEATAQ